jgi:hypothetical protein
MDLNTLLAIGGIGGTVAGTVLGSRAQGKANDISAANAERLFGMADREEQRRNQLTNFLMPQIANSMRMKGGAGGGNLPVFGNGSMPGQQQQPQGLMQPGQSRSGALGKTLGGAALGMQFGGPVGAGIGAGVGAASNLFGRGRRAADPWTQTTQNDFHQQVAGIIDPFNQAQQAGTMTDEARTKAQDDFNRLLAQYTAAANQYRGQGGQQQRVIDNMWRQFGGPGYIPDWKKTLGIS